MNNSSQKSLNYKRINDYKPFNFTIPEITLDFIIETDKVKVVSIFTLTKNDIRSEELKLKGENITLDNIFLNNRKLHKNEYQIAGNELVVFSIIEENNILKIESYIKPKRNTSLLGMYESNNIITTQCEAEGFRKICYHPDRPDVLSKYTVRIEADKEKYPILLSNGNLIREKLIKNKRHEVIWQDPFPKPSYLFALVAGRLKKIEDKFKTKSDKYVKIHLYVEDGDENYVKHAIESLKKAMSWDEEKFNLEYDLNLFNIVAIRHFNMGAMENKSLNIFNSKLILADTTTTTDEELEKIEGVVAHEYFHNWTGNRITCRDWFQLSLKEGLTVYRDQEFTSDIHDRDIKRIEDVKFLRKNQFKEDSGPTSHPVKPDKYYEIDNFYTTTIYEKGSEIIRMAEIISNKENFKRGFGAFISKYDGKAATIDNFIDLIFRSNNKFDTADIEKFKIWYKQNGTPKVSFKRIWDQENKKLTIVITQSNLDKKNKHNKMPLIIPINMAVFNKNNQCQEYKFILKNEEEKFIINKINTHFPKPIVSYFRGFSAPVKWETDLNFAEELFILENEEDLFSVYDSVTRLYKNIINQRLLNKPAIDNEDKLISSILSIIKNKKNINLSILSEILNIPNFAELESENNNIDPLKFYKINNDLNYKFSQRLQSDLLKKYTELELNIYQEWPKGKSERKLIEVIWRLLLYTNDKKIRKIILKFVDGVNMTLSKSALNVYQLFNYEETYIAKEIFYKKWESNNVVLDTWFYFSASIEEKKSIDNLENLFSHKKFDPKSPNTLRSILSGFVTNNRHFHDIDGKSYMYIAEKIIEFDKVNPIIISRFIKTFSRWNSYTEPYKSNMLNAINYLNSFDLSSNSREVINLILNQ